GEGGLGRAQHGVAALLEQALQLVQEHVAAWLADVQQRHRRRLALPQPPPGQGPPRRSVFPGGIEDLHCHGATLRVTGCEPMSPATQPPYTMLNRPASPPAWASRIRSGAANLGTGAWGSVTNCVSIPSAIPSAPRASSPAGDCERS